MYQEKVYFWKNYLHNLSRSPNLAKIFLWMDHGHFSYDTQLPLKKLSKPKKNTE
jgi:hypothetical protein